MERTHILDVKDLVGQSVNLYGWVATRRDHGKIIFIDLRDRSGIVQVVFTPSSKDYTVASELRSEWVLNIKGQVKARPEKMVNPEIETGKVEIEPEGMDVLNKSETPPFPLDTDGYEIGEESRMKYRYLDLRRQRLTKNMMVRHKVTSFIRNWLGEKGFIEIERRGSSIVQIENFRIVITRPPFSDAYEITAVRPIKKLNINDYELSAKLKKRIEEQAEGVLISGSPGQGKSTCASALAEFYASTGKTVKTIEAPRDLQLNDSITQYAISHGSPEEIHDVLLLSRPDYVVFDEMRNLTDFRLFADLRLSGIGIVGVLHATNPVDSIQRFIGKMELGVIPQIIDTVVFIKNGRVWKVLSLAMIVKVPSGMTEADLARPIVEIRDFETNKLEYEVYSYGEETVVVPVQDEKNAPIKELASRHIEHELQREIPGIKAELISDSKAIIYVPENDIGKVIGKNGERISEIEKRIGISIDVQSLDENKKEINYNLSDKGNALFFYVNSSISSKEVDFHGKDGFLFSARVGNKGEIKIKKRSKMADRLLKMLNKNEKIVLKI